MAKALPHVRRAATARFSSPVGGTVAPSAPIVEQPVITTATAVDMVERALPVSPFKQSPAFQLAESTVEDFDRLWDLARTDKIAVAQFLSQSHPNSQSFFQQLGKILAEEREQRAWLRSIKRGDGLCGFVMLSPIVKTPNLAATLHLYLSPEAYAAEGSGRAFEDVIAQLPHAMTLMMVAPTKDFAQHFVDLGFESKIVLTRPALSAAVSHDRD